MSEQVEVKKVTKAVAQTWPRRMDELLDASRKEFKTEVGKFRDELNNGKVEEATIALLTAIHLRVSAILAAREATV